LRAWLAEDVTIFGLFAFRERTQQPQEDNIPVLSVGRAET
jgi:hypothetical protein